MASSQSIKAGEAFIVLRAIDQASPVLQQLGKSFLSFGREMRNFGLGIMAVGGALTAAFIKPVRIASDVTEQQNKFFQIFGTQVGKEVEKRMKAIGQETGRTYLKMYKFAGAFGGLLKGQGATTEAAAEMTKALVKMGVDFSSFNDIMDDTREGSMRRFVSALSGSAEVLDQYGVAAKESALGPALERIFGVGVRGATELQKSTARAYLIYKSMSQQNALDDAIRTSEELANGVRNFKDQLYEIYYHIGKALLPIIGSVVQYLIRAGQAVALWVQEKRDLIIAVALISAGILAIGTAITGIGLGIMFIGAILVGISQILVVIKLLLAGISALVAFITGNFMAILIVFAGVLAALFIMIMYGTKILNLFTEFFSWLTVIGKAMWKAFSTGDFELAWDIFFKTLVYGWDNIWYKVQKVVRFIVNSFIVGALTIKDAFINGFDIVASYVRTIMTNVFAGVQRQVAGMFELMAKAADKVPGMGGSADVLRDMSRRTMEAANRTQRDSVKNLQGLTKRVTDRRAATKEYTDTLAEDYVNWQRAQEKDLKDQWEALYGKIKEANKPTTEEDIVPSEPEVQATGPSAEELMKVEGPKALEKGTLAASRKATQNAQTQSLKKLVDQTEEANGQRSEQNALIEEMLANTGAV